MRQDGMRSPLGRAVGLGSAKEGVEHWWRQRLTAVALVPLGLWFVASLLAHVGGGYEQTLAWLGRPVPAILMIVLIAITFYHAALGAQVVVEDYVHREWVKLGALIALRFACVLLGVAGIFAVLRIAVGG
jgi:succinate dehydrogenase / fumarate reductase membrane anchor subunit